MIFCGIIKKDFEKKQMFEIGEKKLIGIDIGTASIKAVELKIKNKKPVLSNYAMIKIPVSNDPMEKTFSEGFLVACLKRLLREGKFSSGDYFLSIQSFGALIALIKLPQVSEEDMAQAIQFEAHKYIPTSLDQVSLNWGVIKDGSNANEKQILLVAVPKNKIEKYEKIARKIGIEIKSLEIESFSLVRSLIGNDAGKFVIVDIGSRVCNIILVEKGEIKVCRNIDAGGRDITKAVAAGLSVDEGRAESLKASQMDLLGQQSNIKLPSLDLVAGEVKRVLISYYQKEEIIGTIDSIILSGGTANLAGLEKYFSDNLGIKTQIGKPFGRISYDKSLEEKLKEIGPQFSVAAGLALRGLEKE